MSEAFRLIRSDAATLAAAIAAGEVSSVEVTRAHLDQIAATDERYGAFLHVGADEAIDWDDMPETWEDGDVVGVAPKRDQDPRDRLPRGRAVRPENLHDLSGTGGYGVYGGGEDDDR